MRYGLHTAPTDKDTAVSTAPRAKNPYILCILYIKGFLARPEYTPCASFVGFCVFFWSRSIKSFTDHLRFVVAKSFRRDSDDFLI